MQVIYRTVFAALVALPMLYANSAFAASGDSRMKTYIYGKNDIFRIVTSYGYQSSIELDPEEIVETVSLGNSAAFKINPAGSRIFLRPLQMMQTTNMTVVTDKRTYLFEVVSTDESAADVMYVVRFYYPDVNAAMPNSIAAAGGASSPAPSMFIGNAGAPAAQNPMINVPRVSIGGDIPHQPNQQIQPYNANAGSLNQIDTPTMPVPDMQAQTIKSEVTSAVPTSLRYRYNNAF
jgi:type IV secretion system protein VirB9